MPDVFLASGAVVQCDPEDLDLFEASWRIWNGYGVEVAVRDAQSRGRRFRLHLHREVVFRMHPDLVKKARWVKVKARNGDYLDVRRENLEAVVRARKRGGRQRPVGHRRRPFSGTQPHRDPPAWAQPG